MFQVEHIEKSFGSIRACDDISLVVRPGEIVALLGENGAGKSTLLAIMGGYLQPDAGSLVLEGATLTLGSPRQAMQAGIGLVHQHLSLVPTFTVEEQLRLCGWNGDPLPEVIGDLDLKAPIMSLAMGIRQRLEVAKALLTHPTVLLLDEPTSILAPTEVSSLLEMLRELRTSGLGIVLVTHKLPEVLDVADRIVVLCHGTVRGSLARDSNGDWPPNIEATTLSLMFGLEQAAPVGTDRTVSSVGSEDLLQIEGLTVSREGRKRIQDLNLNVKPGEIISVVGVDGQGQRELALAVAGYLPSHGQIRLAGMELNDLSALARAKAGIGLLVDDRLGEAAVGSMSLTENVALKHPRSQAEASRGLMHWPVVRDRTSSILRTWGVSPNDPGRSFATLSGGNMQKLLAGRELDRQPSVLLALNPMQGLDWQTTGVMWSQFRRHCEGGGAVLVFTGDLDEAMSRSDRVVAVAGGRLGHPEPVATIDRQQLARQMVGEW
jgi:simple sugar transport system ATP-binding protein